MNHGFQTLLGMWREATALADPTEPAIRPAGLLSVGLQREDLVSFTSLNIHGQEQAAETLHAFHRVVITRAFQLDALTDWLLDAMRTATATVQTDTPSPGITRTTRETKIETMNAFFGMDLAAADGQTVRLQGMTPTKIALTVETGRLVGQQIEFALLSATNIDISVARTATPPASAPASPLNCSLELAAGIDATTAAANAFTLSLLFDRDTTPAQFTEEGAPTRFALSGGWRATGSGTARLTPAQAQEMRSNGENPFTIRARITTAQGNLALHFVRAAANIRQLEALSDFVHHSIEFIGLSTGELPTFTSITEK